MTSQSHESHRSRFPIPLSLHDLEREPYNLLPYPVDFDDDQHDDTVRSNSFTKLVQIIEQGNRCLNVTNSTGRDMMLLLFQQKFETFWEEGKFKLSVQAV